VAAAFSHDGKRLLVAMQNGTQPDVNSVVCEYSLAELNKAFDDTWTTCQEITDARAMKEVGFIEFVS
jgi:hypothetical protein